jgi:hypothetical protein
MKAITTAISLAVLLGGAPTGWTDQLEGGPYRVEAAGTSGAGRSSSASYQQVAGTAAVGGSAENTGPPSLVVNAGFVAQHYTITGAQGSVAPSSNLPERAVAQLGLVLTTDSATTVGLAPAETPWAVTSGPVTVNDANDEVTAGTVYEKTGALVTASYGGFVAQVPLTIGNTDLDDFGTYAGDGLDDEWQVAFFGEDNPDAAPDRDPDGDGQSNEFEFTAGLRPDDRLSRFFFRLEGVSGEPTHRNLVFGPIKFGRTYRVLSSTTLQGFAPQTLPFTNDGSTRTAVDENAVEKNKFYQIEIGRQP